MQAQLQKERAAAKRSRTEVSLDRFLATKCKDYESFARQLQIIVPAKDAAKARIRFEFNDVQKAYVAARTPRDVILKARQVGMTTEALARDLWHFFTRRGARVVIMCQSMSDHAALRGLSEKIGTMIQGLRDDGVVLDFSTETLNEWTLGGRDASLRIIEAGASVAAAQKKGRSGTITRLHCTELAFWEYAGETLNATLECVPGPEFGTEIEFESTPNGSATDDRSAAQSASGGALFYWVCQDAQRNIGPYGFHFFEWFHETRYRVALSPGEMVVPETERETQLAARGCSPEQLKWYRAKVNDPLKGGQDLVDQEYPSDPDTCFLVSGRTFFDKSITKTLIAGALAPIERVAYRREGAIGELRVFALPEANRSYVIGVDTSEGGGGDASSAHVYERVTGRHMATLDGQFKPWELAKAVAPLGRRYNWATIAVERNNHGHTTLRALVTEAFPKDSGLPQTYPRIFHDRDEKPGWLNHESTRAPSLDTLEQAHRAGHWKPRDIVILRQVRVFIVNARGKPEAQRGAHDDHVLAATIGWDVICRQQPQRSLGGIGAI